MSYKYILEPVRSHKTAGPALFSPKPSHLSLSLFTFPCAGSPAEPALLLRSANRMTPFENWIYFRDQSAGRSFTASAT